MSSFVSLYSPSLQMNRANEGPQPEPEPKPEPEQQRVSNESSFFKLPLEIRSEIYRYLLLADGPMPGLDILFCFDIPRVLHPSIMATCSQIRRESHPILYEENVVQVDLFVFLHIYRTYFQPPAAFPSLLLPLQRKRLQDTKSFEIVYNSTATFLKNEDYRECRTVSREACGFMSQLDGIRFVSLNLTGIRTKPARMRILQTWLQLRNVGRAAVDAGELSMEEDVVVKEFIKVATNKSQLPQVLSALERYVKSPFWAEPIFEVAQNSLDEGSLLRFAMVAGEMIQAMAMDKHLEEAREMMERFGLLGLIEQIHQRQHHR